MRVKLKELRDERGLSVRAVSKSLGISESHYYKIESGLRSPNFILAGEFARFFDSSLEELFFKDVLDNSSKVDVI